MNPDSDVRATLQDRRIHESWTTGYRTPENEPFYNVAFDYLRTVYGPPGDDVVLDAGCGSGTKSIHLARRGYAVLGVDLSQEVLKVGRDEVASAGLSDRIELQCQDLTAMTFENDSFGRVLCWGVLMHVPEVEKAIGELSRVARPGALIVVSEGNMWSLQAVGMRWLKRLLGRQRAELRRTEAGLEHWDQTSSGRLVTRQASMSGLVRAFAVRGVTLVTRRAGEFTELYTMIRWKPARRVVNWFNSIWFRRFRLPGPAFGNLLVFRKDD